jgi:hypothetical protein
MIKLRFRLEAQVMFSSLRFGLEFDKAWKNSFGTSKNDVMRSDNGPEKKNIYKIFVH